MFHRLLALFEGSPTADPDDLGVDPLQRAAAVLLVMAAAVDGHVGEDERATIERLLQSRLQVADPAALFDEAEQDAAASTDLFSVTRVITEKLEPDRRLAIIEMLWEVVLVDSETHDFEASLVRRAAGLLHVDDREAGAARKRVLERNSSAA